MSAALPRTALDAVCAHIWGAPALAPAAVASTDGWALYCAARGLDPLRVAADHAAAELKASRRRHRTLCALARAFPRSREHALTQARAERRHWREASARLTEARIALAASRLGMEDAA